jgi:tRNA A37 threonylcarbamoyltransferase TsaD
MRCTKAILSKNLKYHCNPQINSYINKGTVKYIEKPEPTDLEHLYNGCIKMTFSGIHVIIVRSIRPLREGAAIQNFPKQFIR